MLLWQSSSSPPPAGIDLRDCLESIYPALNAQGAGDLVWWTNEELYGWMDEAAKRLARETGAFVVRDTSTNVVAGTGVYALPTRHLSTIHASIAGRCLDATNAQELEARDASWPDTTAPAAQPYPKRYCHDTDGMEQIRTYPRPNAGGGGVLALVMHQYPATVSEANSVVETPAPLREYFTFAALAEARNKESKGAMPEVGAWFQQMADLLLMAVKDYYGGAQ